MKKTIKTVNELYEYYQITKTMPPRGDGAKFECAKEVHKISMKLLNKIVKSKKIEDAQKIALLLLELCEQITLDNIDEDITVEEMQLYEDLGVE